MSIPVAVTREEVLAQLAVAADFAAAAGLELDASQISEDGEGPCRFYVIFRNRDGELFYAEFDCDDFPLYPPTIEFVDATRSVRGQRSLYPSCFHPTPCVCARYNRKAYAERGGPHGDWRLVDWRLATSGGGAIDTVAMMVSDMDAKIRQSSGRMQ